MEDQIPESSKVSEGSGVDTPLSLPDAVRRFHLSACIVCSRGGHTGHQLYTIIANVGTGDKGLACQDHVKHYIRPKDIKKKRS